MNMIQFQQGNPIEVPIDAAQEMATMQACIEVEGTSGALFVGQELEMCGQKFKVIRQLTKEEFNQRVNESSVSPAWLLHPIGAKFWEISTD